jgi:tetratricopeptide (TPR) repeat protein
MVVDLWNAVGETQRARGDYDRAERSFQSGLALARTELAADESILPSLANNLAGLYKDTERFDQAELLLQESLRQFESQHADSATLATAHLNLAEVYRLQGRLPEAEPRYAKALLLARKSLGAGNPDLAPFLTQTAACARELRRYSRAESLYAEAQALLSRTVGREHPYYAQALEDLGELREAKGDRSGALSSGKQVLEIQRSLLGADHPDVARTYVTLARRSPRGPEATRWLEQAIAIFDSTRAYPEARVEARSLRARWSAAAGDLPAARADLALALEDIDTLRARRGGGDPTRVVPGRAIGLLT